MNFRAYNTEQMKISLLNSDNTTMNEVLRYTKVSKYKNFSASELKNESNCYFVGGITDIDCFIQFYYTFQSFYVIRIEVSNNISKSEHTKYINALISAFVDFFCKRYAVPMYFSQDVIASKGASKIKNCLKKRGIGNIAMIR